jgi:hypothetical protein
LKALERAGSTIKYKNGPCSRKAAALIDHNAPSENFCVYISSPSKEI